jgi:hypothetical protein
VAKQADGSYTAAGATGSTSTGNATLSSSNYNALSWGAVSNAASYDVYRVSGGTTQGKIANVTADSYSDQGAPGDGTTAPATNTTGAISATGGNGPLPLTGSLAVLALANPSAPTVTPQGTAGSTSYSYVVVGLQSDGSTTAASAAGSTSTGNATLSSSNNNFVSWPAVPMAVSYSVYRTVGGSTQGKIASGLTSLSLIDTGLAGDGTTAPSVNTTGSITANGRATFNAAVTANQPVTIGAALTLNGAATLNQAVTFNQTALFNQPVTFANPVNAGVQPINFATANATWQEWRIRAVAGGSAAADVWNFQYNTRSSSGGSDLWLNAFTVAAQTGALTLSGQVYVTAPLQIRQISSAGVSTFNGKISSSMWNLQQPMSNTPGPLTLSASFTTHGGTVLLIVSGSGYTTTAGTIIGMNILVDGTSRGASKIYANAASTHVPFVPVELVITGLTAASHTLALTAIAGTLSDANDFFTATVIEFPF